MSRKIPLSILTMKKRTKNQSLLKINLDVALQCGVALRSGKIYGVAFPHNASARGARARGSARSNLEVESLPQQHL
jgi:hypothetical protein